jgi:hypothetical protein
VSDTISIIAGGWSAGQVNLAKLPGLVVAVNESVVFAPRIDVALSMDRKWTEYRWPWLAEGGTARRFDVCIRRSATKNIRCTEPWFHIFENDHTTARLSTEQGVLNGTNSAGCALNYAFQRHPGTMYLLGFDQCVGPKGEWHWFAKNTLAPKVGAARIQDARYANWAKEYAGPAEQMKAAGIRVVNVSDISLITCFEKMSPRDFNRMFA